MIVFSVAMPSSDKETLSFVEASERLVGKRPFEFPLEVDSFDRVWLAKER